MGALLVGRGVFPEPVLGEAQGDRYRRRVRAFDGVWRRELPFVGKSTALILGPPPKPAYCAAGENRDDPACTTTWRRYFERDDELSGVMLLR